jgi:hypothetical protein
MRYFNGEAAYDWAQEILTWRREYTQKTSITNDYGLANTLQLDLVGLLDLEKG